MTSGALRRENPLKLNKIIACTVEIALRFAPRTRLKRDDIMTQTERRVFLIQKLIDEQPMYRNLQIPVSEAEQKTLLRSLMNVRAPLPIGKEFLKIQNEYLQNAIKEKGITNYKTLSPVKDGIYLWRGDITTLKCDAIVNAANSEMLGCFYPNHACIDNTIHTYAGVQLRIACADIMKKQGCEEETGKAKITPAFNLPSSHIIHTVGPIIHGKVTQREKDLLADCYRSCLELAEVSGVKSIAFCCISTGEFHFPNDKAAEIAIKTVSEYKKDTNSQIEVIFNVFKESDYKIYRKLLG